jgi:hypothetical protein
MGRSDTGADTTSNAPKLRLTELLKAGLFRKIGTVTARVTWDQHNWCEIEATTMAHTRYMDLTTCHRDCYGKPYVGTQRIHLMSKPSNLGKGRVLYFRCPFTYQYCRILYRAYSSPTWRSRKGFSWRLYYPQQTMSGFTRHAQREIYMEGKLERMYAKRGTSTYKGIPTRRAQRIAKLEAEYERLTAAGWDVASFPVRIRRLLERGL